MSTGLGLRELYCRLALALDSCVTLTQSATSLGRFQRLEPRGLVPINSQVHSSKKTPDSMILCKWLLSHDKAVSSPRIFCR